ncbi:MAG: cytochrome c biogenesis protein CcdA [Thermoleophilaceae bacterium]|nr:cytochrome c biogenesis protein CcdA [Thermoleophilaceae bacterium]
MLAAAAGFVSFLSPCCLPLVPGYLAVVTGESASEITKPGLRAMSRAFLFVATFSSIFVLVGLSATAAGSFITGNQELLTKVAGLSIAVMGVIFVASTVANRMKFSWRSSALIERAENGRGAPVIAGAAFAVAWTPCVGPTLGAILGLAALQGTAAQGALLLAAYSAGLAIPFLLTAAGVQFLQNSFGFIRRHYDAIQLASGLVLVAIGALVFSGEFFRLNILARSFIDSTGLDFLDFLWRM